jgi:hypothetical protein
MKKILQICRKHNMVIVLYKDENGNVCDKKYTKFVTNEEIRADINGEKLTKNENTDQDNSEKEKQEAVSLNYPANTARATKEEQQVKRAQYLYFLNKIGVHEFDNERSFSKIEAAYNKYAKKKAGK